MTTTILSSQRIFLGFSRALLTAALSSVLSLHVNGQAPLDQRVDALESKLGDLDKKLGDMDKKLDRLLSTPRNDPQQLPSAPAKALARSGSETPGAVPKPETRTIVSKPGAILSAYELSSPAQADTMQTGLAALFHFVDESASFKKSNFLSRQPGPTFAKSILGVLWEGYLDIAEEDKYLFTFDAIMDWIGNTPGESDGKGIVVMLGELNLLSGREWNKGACTSKPIPLSKGRYELRVWLANGVRQKDHTLSFSYMPLGGSAPRPITPRSLFHEAEKELK